MGSRLRGILFSPRAEWDRIAAEDRGAVAVLALWVLPLALAPFATVLLRFLLMASILGVQASLALAPYVLADAAAQYAFVVAWTFAVALIVDLLAPRFEGQRGFARAYTVVAYAATPALLASLLWPFPWVRYLGLGGLVWALLLLRLGLPRLMRSPDRRSTAYAITVTAIAILLALLLLLMPSCAQTGLEDGGGGVAGVLVPAGGKAAPTGDKGKSTSSPDEPLVGVDKQGTGALNLDDLPKESIREMIDRTVDPKKMRELEEAARIAAETAGKIPFKPAEPSMLGELVPAVACGQPRQMLDAKLARFPKGELAQALAQFSQPGGDVQVRMEIGDNSPRAGGMSQLRKIMPNQSQTTTRGYQRRRSEGEVYIDDRWDAPRREAYFAVLIADRFVVHATATGVDEPGCAESAVRSVDWKKLADMAQAPVR